MWLRKKSDPAGPAFDVDAAVEETRAAAASGGPEDLGRLAGVLRARAILALRDDRYDDHDADLWESAEALRALADQGAPAPEGSSLTWMMLSSAEHRRGDVDAALAAGLRGASELGDDDPELVAAFVSDAVRLRDELGQAQRLPEAVAAASMASDVLAWLAGHDEARWAGDLGISLHNEALARALAGDLQSAVAVQSEAVAVLQEAPGASESLTGARRFLAKLQEQTGSWEGAVETQQAAAVEVHGEEPTVEEVERLNTLFITQVRAGHREEAEQTIAQAIDVARRLADEQPHELSRLAVLLGNQANVRGELGRDEEALASSEEALQLREHLVATTPSRASEQGLAMVLNNHAAVLRRLGRHSQAVVAAARSVDVRRRLAADGEPNDVALLANALNTHAEQLGTVDQADAGLQLAEEAQELFDGLPQPGAKAYFRAANDETRARLLTGLGRLDEAILAARASVAYARLAAKEEPGRTPMLASSLEVLAEAFEQVGRADEGSKARAEAASLRASQAPGS